MHRLSEQTPRVEVVHSLRLAMLMIYTFLSSVFIALFLVVGTLALIAVLCFICACIFGAQIPYYYAA